MRTPDGRAVTVLDLPGAYSLNATSADEAITRDVVLGTLAGEARPDLIVCVTDATNLKLNLRMVLEVRRFGVPLVLALNMTDVAKKRGIEIDVPALARELGMPVVETVAVRKGGADGLVHAIAAASPEAGSAAIAPTADGDVAATYREVRRILAAAVRYPAIDTRVDDTLDRVLLHPLWGMLILATTLFLVFQAVFSWATLPMDAIKSGVEATASVLRAHLADGPLRSLLVDGVIAGAGSVLVFLPQILILFFFLLFLEDSGYLPRAAFLLDRVMGTVGLSGRSFIPLLSSFACAVPGIMATRTISNPRDRLATIMIAPLMTCSARLPVYALIIGAFIPDRTVAGAFNLQGLVLFALYVAGIASAMAVAFVMQWITGRKATHPLLMELPSYRWPNARNLVIGLWERAHIFLARVGTIILSLMIVIWFLSTLPGAAGGRDGRGDPVQLRGHARPRPRAPVRAARLQLADLHRARPGSRRARGCRRCARHGVRVVRHRHVRGGRADARDRGQLAARDRVRPPRLVRVRAAMHLDPRDRAAGNQFLALSAADDGLPVRAGVRRGFRDLPLCPGARGLG